MTAIQEKQQAADQAINILGKFIADTPNDHVDKALARSRRAFLDTIGCMFLGSKHEVTQTAFNTVSEWGMGDRLVVGTDRRLAAPWAMEPLRIPSTMMTGTTLASRIRAPFLFQLF